MDSNNKAYVYRIQFNQFGGTSGYGSFYSQNSQSSDGLLPFNSSSTDYREVSTWGGVIDFATKSEYGWLNIDAISGIHEMKGFVSFDYNDTNNRIHGIGFVPTTYGFYFFGAGTELLLYKYIES